MAGGPIFPHSVYPGTGGKTFPWIHTTGTTRIEGLGVVSSLATASVIWQCQFAMPPTLPSGTGKLRLLALASDANGSANVNVTWASVAADEDPGAASLNAEGSQDLDWASDANAYKELKTTLDADTLVADEIVVMEIQFGVSGWGQSAITTWIPMIIWE